MTNKKNSFESIVDFSFSDEEQFHFRDFLEDPLILPIHPVIIDLVDLAANIPQTVNERNAYLSSDILVFLRENILNSGLDLGDQIMLKNPVSAVDNTDEDKYRISIFPDTSELHGSFLGFELDEWFDVGEREAVDFNIQKFARKNGIYIYIGDIKMHYNGKIFEKSGYVRVPLNHGTPELYKIA